MSDSSTKTTQQKIDDVMNYKPAQQVCPNCGYCPCCGRSRHWSGPIYPYYPYPYSPPVWTVTSGGSVTG